MPLNSMPMRYIHFIRQSLWLILFCNIVNAS